MCRIHIYTLVVDQSENDGFRRTITVIVAGRAVDLTAGGEMDLVAGGEIELAAGGATDLVAGGAMELPAGRNRPSRAATAAAADTTYMGHRWW